jgi:hypothetical protein
MKRILGGSVAVAATLAVAATVQGGETDRAAYDFKLSAKTPSTPSGLSVHVVLKHPDDPEAKPPALDGAELGLPPGMKIDDSAVPRCEATDDDFQMQGRDACPADTQVGEGAVTVMTGVPPADPQTLDIVAFNGEGEVVEVVFFPDTNAVAGIDRVTIEDDRLVAHPPSPPGGPPDGRTAIRELKLEVPRRLGPNGDPYVTTPPDCANGAWLSRGHFEFADGGQTVVPSESSCEPQAAVHPGVEVSVAPRRTRVGRRSTFQIEVSSADARCIRRARVRLGKRRPRRTNENGRLELKARFARRGARWVKVSKRGCAPARTKVKVARKR